MGKSKGSRGLYVGIALAVAAVVVLAIGLVYDSHRVEVAVSESESTYVAPAAAALPETVSVDMNGVRKAMFIGDSLTRGVGAVPEQAGFAYLAAQQLGAPPVVWGFGGTGFVNRGASRAGNYEELFANIGIFETPDLVVVQGSTNDSAAKPNDIRANANSFVDEIQFKFPRAQVVLVGPELLDLTQRPKLNQVSWAVRQAAIDQDIRFVNPMADDWFTSKNLPEYTQIDPGGPARLTNAGHAYFADKLLDNLRTENLE